MPTNINGQGNTYNLPNYSGELFTIDAEKTPFVAMAGGLTGGKQTSNHEFAIDSTFSYPTAAQPSISENASATAPTALSYVRDQSKNVTQIFHEAVDVTYRKLSNSGRLAGLNTAGQNGNVVSEKDFQIARALGKIARDVEHTFLNGTYNLAVDGTTADKTRGMFELCATGNTVAGAGALLGKAMIDSLLRTMFTNGAQFDNMVLFTNAYQKQVLSQLYGYAPQSRNVGGLNIQEIETDFGKIGVVLNRFVASDKILVADMAHVAPVFQLVPEKGFLFYEELSKTGAAEKGQIFGQIGLDHGNKALHGSITGLSIA
jgi:hypothetical protein